MELIKIEWIQSAVSFENSPSAFIWYSILVQLDGTWFNGERGLFTMRASKLMQAVQGNLKFKVLKFLKYQI